MSLKILGGDYRGIPLESPSGKNTRPTLSMVRQAVFNMCQQKIENSLFLDLFAGTGAMGLEALSRGAKEAFFVEKQRQALHCLKNNIQKLHVEEKAIIYPVDVLTALKRLSDRSFDLIYIDPPYGEKKEEIHSEPLVEKILLELDSDSLVSIDGWVFLEFSLYSKKDFKKLPLKNLHYDHSRDFARTTLHLFKKS